MRDAAVARLDRLWNMVSSVAVEAALIRFAGDLSERHALRGYDAVHLAALIGTGPPGTVSLCCWDSNLRMAAGQLGYALIPTSL